MSRGSGARALNALNSGFMQGFNFLMQAKGTALQMEQQKAATEYYKKQTEDYLPYEDRLRREIEGKKELATFGAGLEDERTQKTVDMNALERAQREATVRDMGLKPGLNVTEDGIVIWADPHTLEVKPYFGKGGEAGMSHKDTASMNQTIDTYLRSDPLLEGKASLTPDQWGVLQQVAHNPEQVRTYGRTFATMNQEKHAWLAQLGASESPGAQDEYARIVAELVARAQTATSLGQLDDILNKERKGLMEKGGYEDVEGLQPGTNWFELLKSLPGRYDQYFERRRMREGGSSAG